MQKNVILKNYCKCSVHPEEIVQNQGIQCMQKNLYKLKKYCTVHNVQWEETVQNKGVKCTCRINNTIVKEVLYSVQWEETVQNKGVKCTCRINSTS